MQNSDTTVVVLGTGGTIAGTADDPADTVGYSAGRLGVAELVARLPALSGVRVQSEEVARIDSKDIDWAVWCALAAKVAYHADRSDVAGVVVTHGTDTLEETAYLLQRVLAPEKPVVLTAAMRPATALLSDGPQNLLDAVQMALQPGARGVLAVLAGTVHGAPDVRKVHTHRLDAFSSGDAGPLGVLQNGVFTQWRDWPSGVALGLSTLRRRQPPRVALVFSHGDADGGVVEALRAQGVDGIVVAGTGNGRLHRRLEAALLQAQREGGVRILRCSRVAQGAVLPAPGDAFESAGALSPGQARIELLLRLLAAEA